MRTAERAPAWLIVLAVLLASCSQGESQTPGTNGATGSPGGRGRGTPTGPVPVEVALVENGRISRSVAVSGNIEPLRTIAVNSQLAGAVRTVNVEEGSIVDEGAVLATIDDREIVAQLTSAEAAFEVAEATFQRAERLRERQVITAAEYERDRAALAAARAQRDQLRARAGYATVLAPIAGVVTEKSVEVGHIVGVQTRLFSIADISTLVVRVRVSELDVVSLRAGDAAEIVLDAFPAQPLTGRIRRVFPAADPVSRLVPVEVALTGPDAAIARPGFLARVAFALGARENVRLVPASAVITDPSGAHALYVIDQGRAERRLVRTGLISEGRLEIVDGVEVGEVIVITGTNNLRDGVEVRIVNPATGPGGAEARPEGGNSP